MTITVWKYNKEIIDFAYHQFGRKQLMSTILKDLCVLGVIVFKWNVDQVVHWLKNVVGLPQYENTFREKNIDGRCIPR